MDLAPFIKLAEGIHPVVDYTQLQACYPEIEDEVSNISSASDLLGWEKLREQYEIRDSQEVPCDIIGAAGFSVGWKSGLIPFIWKA
jgi:hypothetical protein